MSCPSREQSKQVFKEIAGDDGKLTVHELRDAMAGKGYDVVKIFSEIDKDGDMIVTEDEFLEQVLKTPRTKALETFFDSVDTNKSGDVTMEELTSYLEKSEEGKKLIADVEKMKKDFETMDKDGSQSVTRQEFIEFMNKQY